MFREDTFYGFIVEVCEGGGRPESPVSEEDSSSAWLVTSALRQDSLLLLRPYCLHTVVVVVGELTPSVGCSSEQKVSNVLI